MKCVEVSQKHKKRMFLFYVAFLLIWSIAILLMPIASANKDVSRILLFISGGGFWVGLFGTVTMAIRINRFRKRSDGGRNERLKIKEWGLLCFFKNKDAKVADSVMMASVVGFVITRICTDNLYIPFILLALFVFSFGMHCMLNGKNYSYLNLKDRREES